jgi:predicted  nucleic acid-binding Zn-ribbon protein
MEEEAQILIDVQLETKDFDKEVGEINTQIKENNERIKDLSKNYKENAT